MPDRHIPVLVVGGSLVGLSTSVLLARYGVPHLLVEAHSGTAIHPRAASFHQATMEVFRAVGLQEEVEQAAATEFRQNGAIIAVESLGGKELKYFYRSYNDGVEGLSPTSRLFITQVGLEPILRRRAAELGAEHMFGTELVSFSQDAGGATALIRPRDGSEQRVTADYLVAADGAHSRVRHELGIPMTGRGSFADCITIYFRSDVNRFLGERNLSVVYVNHPELLGFFRFSYEGDAGFLAVFATFDEQGNRNASPGEDVSVEHCTDLVRRALGADADHPVAVESVQRWRASADTAESFRQGRVFLAGDSAHVMPPTGGFGGNTGVADAYNLAWKLAFVLGGTAGEGLLDTYDEERRPVGRMTVEQAYTRYVTRVDPSLPDADLAPPLDDAAIELGAVYRSAAVCADGSTGNGLDDPHAGRWTVGARVPHVPVTVDGREVSTLDLAGGRFALLVGERQGAWQRAAEDVTRSLGVPLGVHVVPEAASSDGEEGSGWTGAALVRPDGVLAWKPTGHGDGAGQLADVVAGVLGRGQPTVHAHAPDSGRCRRR